MDEGGDGGGGWMRGVMVEVGGWGGDGGGGWMGG